MNDGTVPEYVLTVLKEFREARLQLVKKAPNPLPSRRSPIVISVVKNEIDRLPDFLRHYRSIGIERFVFIDNESTDATREFLASQPDTDVYLKDGAFNWMLKQGWICKIVETYGYGRWYLYADADEHVVFDGCDRRTCIELVGRMEQIGITRVRGLLIDMYRRGPLVDSSYARGDRLLGAYPWFDRDTYREGLAPQMISVRGGPRERVFRQANTLFEPELTKYPLFRAAPDEYMVNPHHFWPYEGNFTSPRYLGILHFKFLPGFVERAKQAVDLKNYWNESIEYRCYLQVLDRVPDASLADRCSERYVSVSQLVGSRIIARIPWIPEEDYLSLKNIIGSALPTRPLDK